MIITYHDKQFCRLQVGDLVVAYNPFEAKGSKRFGADMAISSVAHPDYNGFNAVTYGEKVPFIIDGPGDYEHSGINVKGSGFSVNYADEPFINTIYTFEIDGIRVCGLGLIDKVDSISSDTIEQLGTADIVIASLEPGTGLSIADVFKATKLFQPAVIIPIYYTKDSLDDFFKEAGVDAVKPIEKLTIKKKDIDHENLSIVPLSM